MPSAPSAGDLLAAAPVLGDPNFRRSVVLLCETQPDGAFGLVLTDPLELYLADVLDGFADEAHPLMRGGPVQPDTLHFLHRRPDLLPDAREVAPDVWWGGSFDAVRKALRAGTAQGSDFRFYLGYAGWSLGQLEGEIAGDDWLVARATPALVFGTDPSALWRQTMRSLGPPAAYLADYPEDLRVN
jgi:putative transcriptional regulator